MELKFYLFLINLLIKNIEKLRKIIKKEHTVVILFILLKIIKLKVISNHFIANE